VHGFSLENAAGREADPVGGSPGRGDHISPEEASAACSRLFAEYPLAVTPPSAEDGNRSMVLVKGGTRQPAFFVLTQDGDDLFAIRSWHDTISQEIRPDQNIPGLVGRILAEAMPVPRGSAVLGWVSDRRVTAILAAEGGQPATQQVPDIYVMPRSLSSELDWPPFTTSPLGDWRLWDHVARGLIVDIAPLLTRRAGYTFWAPGPYGRNAGCFVVKRHLVAEDYWLPAGVYLDHWMLREGVRAPLPGLLLTTPGAVDLALHSCLGTGS